jgi:hypothetical protein
MQEALALERLDPLTRGILFHEIQKRLFQALAGDPAEGEARRLALDALDRILRETAAEYAERLAPAIPQIWHNEVERLRADLRGWLAAVGSDESSWVPSGVERKFESVVIAEQWKLHGRMDLIEQSAEGAFPTRHRNSRAEAKYCSHCSTHSRANGSFPAGASLADDSSTPLCAVATALLTCH